jgi:hypothetical protein
MTLDNMGVHHHRKKTRIRESAQAGPANGKLLSGNTSENDTPPVSHRRRLRPLVPCCVPHCRRMRRPRSTDGDGVEWLCPDHWRTVSPTARRRYKRLQQRARRGDDPMWLALAFEQWKRLKAQAIERAAGIS